MTGPGTNHEFLAYDNEDGQLGHSFPEKVILDFLFLRISSYPVKSS